MKFSMNQLSKRKFSGSSGPASSATIKRTTSLTLLI